MTVTTGEESLAVEDRFFTAEDPPDLAGPQAPATSDTPPPDDPDRAPYGWTRDTGTHLWRPKKSPGRPKSQPPPGPDEVAAGPALEPGEDQPPPEPDGKRKHRAPPTDADTPMPRGGVIAKGVDRLYRRAGRILKILAPELGVAVIECTKPDPDDEDAPTVGQAWEALARDNPRVRAWLLGLIKGGTWQDLIMAHAPIAIALLTYDWVRRLIPGATLERAAEVFLTGEDGEELEGDGLTPADVADMEATAQAQAEHIASRLGVKVPPGVAAAAMKQAEAMAAAREAPEAFQRQQPRNNSRAKRRSGR